MQRSSKQPVYQAAATASKHIILGVWGRGGDTHMLGGRQGAPAEVEASDAAQQHTADVPGSGNSLKAHHIGYVLGQSANCTAGRGWGGAESEVVPSQQMVVRVEQHSGTCTVCAVCKAAAAPHIILASSVRVRRMGVRGRQQGPWGF